MGEPHYMLLLLLLPQTASRCTGCVMGWVVMCMHATMVVRLAHMHTWISSQTPCAAPAHATTVKLLCMEHEECEQRMRAMQHKFTTWFLVQGLHTVSQHMGYIYIYNNKYIVYIIICYIYCLNKMYNNVQ